jgi:hypothetical protein
MSKGFTALLIAAREESIGGILDTAANEYGYKVLDWRKEGSQSAPRLCEIATDQAYNFRIAVACSAKFPIILHWLLDNLWRNGIFNPTDSYRSDCEYPKVAGSSILLVMASEEAARFQASLPGRELSRMGVLMLRLHE